MLEESSDKIMLEESFCDEALLEESRESDELLEESASKELQDETLSSETLLEKENEKECEIREKPMPKKLIPDELNSLIQEYLTDGFLSNKERQVILKKAVGMGLDKDEIDLYIDAQIQKLDLDVDFVARRMNSKPCPYCGTPVPQLTDKCPECGQFVTSEASGELKMILDNLDEALVELKSGTDLQRLQLSKAIVEQNARKANVYYGNNPKVKKLLADIEIELVEAEKRIKSIKRAETTKAFLSNPWSYAGLFITLTFLFIAFCGLMIKLNMDEYNQDKSILWFAAAFLGGIACVWGTVAFIKNVCLKNTK